MRLLVIRTSAMGDVALTVPVLKSLVEQYPSVEVTLLTRGGYAPFFANVPRLNIVDAGFYSVHKGIAGVFRLYNKLKREGSFDHIIDFHDVTRSRLLRYLFRFSGSVVHVIDKGRKEKKKLLREGSDKGNLRHTVNRYCDVLAAAGFPVVVYHGRSYEANGGAKAIATEVIPDTDMLAIGVAPYAKHPLKMWPEENMKELLRLISERNRVVFYLFGGGAEEEAMLKKFAADIQNSVIIAGRFSLAEELALMGRLDFMICMDSSNMHMADLAGTRVVSVWGGTHPAAGFSAFGQPFDYQVQVPVSTLNCRPCTIYGAGRCRRGDKACMVRITPGVVMDKLVKLGFVK